ncbi:hypothetical protein [Moraxella lacunata]|uniref:hypothetical protein n=1 Tax=Moraxella lacunata TaxID=477 RepID=UPI003EDFF22B
MINFVSFLKFFWYITVLSRANKLPLPFKNNQKSLRLGNLLIKINKFCQIHRFTLRHDNIT